MKNRTVFLLVQTILVLSISVLGFSARGLSAQAPTSPMTAVSMNILVNDWSHDKPDTNPGDGQCKTSSGSCTLRAAIQEANASPGTDLIFSIYDNSVTFALNSPLPTITGAVTLLGAQEEGKYMHIDGASLPFGTHGLQLMGDNITIQRMAITNFTGSGVWIEGASNVVEDSLLGTTYTGASGVGNGDNGITIHSGGYNEIRGNVVAGNGQSGVLIQDGAFNKVLNGNT
ncbi:MAG: right-handed parallel beta-helix repeat-containing protein, partial [Anaerolineales bacterium]